MSQNQAFAPVRRQVYIEGLVRVPFKTTLSVRDQCLCLHLQRAARAVARRFDDALRPLGLTNGQFSLLMSLNRPEPPNMASVAALLAMDRTTLTAALKPLLRRGLVRVRVDPEDGRRHVTTLTANGRKLLARAVPVWKGAHVAVEERLKDDGAEQLRRNLRTLC